MAAQCLVLVACVTGSRGRPNTPRSCICKPPEGGISILSASLAVVSIVGQARTTYDVRSSHYQSRFGGPWTRLNPLSTSECFFILRDTFAVRCLTRRKPYLVSLIESLTTTRGTRSVYRLSKHDSLQSYRALYSSSTGQVDRRADEISCALTPVTACFHAIY